MADIFDNIVYCSKCRIRMRKRNVARDGFSIRVLQCSRCGKRIYHPSDIEEYKRFSELKNKAFKVKLRIVGNSYAVSIPKEIVEFIHEQERVMDDIVKLCLEEAGKLSLIFKKELEKK
jgi:hypothetical protein